MLKNDIIGSKLWVINMYREQLRKFDNIGLGKQTENGVKITHTLIDVTRRRLNQLSTIYDNGLSHHSLKTRSARKLIKEKLSANNVTNGTIITPGSKNNGNT